MQDEVDPETILQSGGTYHGWRIKDHGANYHPRTGRWRAERFGVGMGSGTAAGLRTMIIQRANDEEKRKKDLL